MSPHRPPSGEPGQHEPHRRALPVDAARLKRHFPELTAEDVAAYEEVTRRILAEPSPGQRARLIRETLARGSHARDKQAAGGALVAGEVLDFRYLQAVAKMQGSTVHR
jgi:hypothetical protein